MANMLSGMYNATGYTLSWGTGAKFLTTGVASFQFHLLPAGPSLNKTFFGAQSTYQAMSDRIAGIRAGDFLVVTEWAGETQTPPRRFKIDGIAEYPHQFLGHLTIALSEGRQS